MKRRPPGKSCLAILALVAACVLTGRSAAQQASGAPEARALTPEEEKAADMRMPNLDRSGLLPELRKPEEVKPGERNPFAVAAKALERFAGVVTDTERDRIERVLRAMRISGVSVSSNGRRALLGPFPLAEGEQLPPLFADQVESLVVKKITDKEVVLEFLDSDPSKPGRPVSLPIGFESGADSVRSLRVGEAFRKVVPLNSDGSVALPPLQSDAAQAVLKAIEDEDLKGWVNRQTELLDAPAGTSSDEGARP